MFIARKSYSSLLTFNRDRNNLGIESSSSDGPSSAGLRSQRKFVLLLACNLVLLGEHLGGFTHNHLRQRTEESVTIHAIHEFLVPQPISPARTVEIIRKPRHRLSSARENATRLSQQNRLISQRNRLHCSDRHYCLRS